MTRCYVSIRYHSISHTEPLSDNNLFTAEDVFKSGFYELFILSWTICRDGHSSDSK